MFVGENIVYLDLQKTGSTQITKVLLSIPSEKGKKHRKHISFHELPEESKLDWDEKIKLGSIRNPWAWYVSLWAYGCQGQGAWYKKNTHFDWKHFRSIKKISYLFIPRKKWRKVYSDVHSKENFKAWLSMVLGIESKKNSCFFPQKQSKNLIGIYTLRYLRLYLKDFITLQSQFKSKNAIIQLDQQYNMLDYTIRQENLQTELLNFLRQQGIEISPDIQALFYKKRNSSYHLHYKEYYDDESVNWIIQKEWLIVNKYGYIYEQK